MNRRALLASLTVLACQGGGDDASVERQRQQPIVNGDITSAYPAAVDVNGCTGALISPRVVLTAAHCTDAWEPGGFNEVRFGPNPDSYIDVIPFIDWAVERRYLNANSQSPHDIALVRLERDAPAAVAPVPYNTTDLTPYEGLEATVVGYGETAYQRGDYGVKHYYTSFIEDVQASFIIIASEASYVCYGDSGGPTFATIDGEQRVIGVTSQFRSGEPCFGNIAMTRPDVYNKIFIEPIVSAWDGPCSEDDFCNMSGCAYPDPDCGPCGFEGTCMEGCPQVDLDCPSANWRANCAEGIPSASFATASKLPTTNESPTVRRNATLPLVAPIRWPAWTRATVISASGPVRPRQRKVRSARTAANVGRRSATRTIRSVWRPATGNVPIRTYARSSTASTSAPWRRARVVRAA